MGMGHSILLILDMDRLKNYRFYIKENITKSKFFYLFIFNYIFKI